MIDDLNQLGLTARNRLAGQGLAVQTSFPFGSTAYRGTTNEGVWLSASTAQWVFDVVKKLGELARLQKGWDSYGGLPLNPSARRATLEAIRSLQREELPSPNVSLSSGGKVHLEWVSKG